MKKVTLFVLFICFSVSLSAQKHQVKLDLLDVLVLKTLDVAYEHQLNDEATLGLSVFINFEDEDKDFRYNEDFQLVPYFRQFFPSTSSFHVFGELFGSLNFAKAKDTLEDYSDFALGLGGGIQRVSENGYVFELNAGLGRNLFNSDVSRELVPRFGISVGKKF